MLQTNYNYDLSKYTDITYNVVLVTIYIKKKKNNIFILDILFFIYWNDTLIKVLLSIDKDHNYLENKVKINKILKKYC